MLSPSHLIVFFSQLIFFFNCFLYLLSHLSPPLSLILWELAFHLTMQPRKLVTPNRNFYFLFFYKNTPNIILFIYFIITHQFTKHNLNNNVNDKCIWPNFSRHALVSNYIYAFIESKLYLCILGILHLKRSSFCR